MSIWKKLGIDPTGDLGEVKRAYSRQLKLNKPDKNPKGYQELREAFEFAKKYVKNNHNIIEDDIDDLVSPVIDDKEEIKEISNIQFTEQNDELIAIQQTAVINSRDSDDLKREAVNLIEHLDQILKEKTQVEAVTEFQQQLNLNINNGSIEFSDIYEIEILAYLDSWCLKFVEKEEEFMPLGLMRKIISHYRWHQRKQGDLFNYPYFNQCYDEIWNASGEKWLQRVKSGHEKLDYDAKASAKILLGRHRPKYFKWLSLSSSRRQSIFKLLNRIEGMSDSSLDFELNTDTIHWWLQARDRFLLSSGMILTGYFAGLVALLSFLGLPESYNPLPFLDRSSVASNPLLWMLIFCTITSCLVCLISYLFHYARKSIVKALGPSAGLLYEIIASCILIMAVVNVNSMVQKAPDLATVLWFACFCLATFLYRSRMYWVCVALFILFFTSFLVHSGFASSIFLRNMLLTAIVYHTYLYIRHYGSIISSKNEGDKSSELSLHTIHVYGGRLAVFCFIYSLVGGFLYKIYV